MAIVQISKMQQRAGNLVDLPQLDNGELGWASDANRLFIGRTGSTYSSENIEVLTSYSTVSLSQISGSDGGNLNINAAENGQILTYVSSTNTWENYTGNSDQLFGGKLNLGDPANITMAGGAIGYVLQTDGTGNLSWTGQTGGSGGGGAPGGANTSVQFNDAGVFGGSANLSFNKTTRVLAVTGNVNANNFVGNLANGTTSIRFSAMNGNLTFTTNGSTVMTATTGGNVGIGTSLPTQKLEVSLSDTTTNRTNPVNVEAITATSTISGGAVFTGFGPALVFRSQSYDGLVYSGPRVRMVIGDNSISTTAGSSLAFDVTATKGASPTQAVIIDSGGNLGVGTDSPAVGVRLDTYGGYMRLRSNTTINADISGIVNALVFESSGGTGEHAIIAGGNTSANFLSFYTANTAAPAERMRITSSGNVGIGTDAPVSKLDVRSGYITSGTATSTTGTKILAGYYSSGIITTFGSEYSSGGPVIGYSVWPSTSVAGAFVSSSPSNLYRGAYTISGNQHIWYGGTQQTVAVDSPVTMTELMRIDSSGNVGIGTNSPTRKLDVSGTPLTVGGDATGVLVSVVNTGIAYNASPTSAISLWNKFNVAGSTFPSAVLQAGKENATDGNYAGYMSLITVDSVGAPAEKMRITSSGNVGIGTNLPTGKLEASVGLLPSTSGSQIIIERLSGTTSNASYLDVSLIRDSIGTSWTTSATRLQQKIDSTWMGFMQFNGTTNQGGVTFGAGSSTVSATSIPEYLYLLSGGNVGIGTPTPSSRLVVNGGTSTSQIRWEVANAAYTQEVSTNAAQNAYVYKSNDASYHLWKISSTTRMTLDSNSRLLINIDTSKTYGGQLQVLNNIQAIGGSSDDSPLIASYDFNALDATPTYSSAVLRKFGSTAAGNLYFAAIAANGWAEIGGINVQSGVAFGANGAVPLVFANSAERMRIDSSGNVQIGSATATAAAGLRYLDIYNAENTNGSSGAIIRLVTSNVASNANITVDLVKYKNGAFVIANNETNVAAYTAFVVGASERMRINSSGNVGIGVVPSSLWGSTAKVLQIGAFSAFYQNMIGYPEMAFNSYEYANNAYKYLIGTVNRASLYSQRGGSHDWYLAPVGTAGDVITYTQAMTIRTTGAIAFNGAANYGTSGQVLTSQADAPPIWTTVATSGGTVTSVSGTGTVNGLTLSGTVTTTGSLTLSGSLSGSVADCTVDGTNPVGFRNIPQNSQNQYYTCVLADAGKHIFHPPGGGSGTYEIPPNSSVAYPLGTAISFVNLGSIQNITCGDTMYFAGTGTTGIRVLAQYGTATALKVQATGWIISGTGLT